MPKTTKANELENENVVVNETDAELENDAVEDVEIEKLVFNQLEIVRKEQKGKDGKTYYNYSVKGVDPVLEKDIVANFLAYDRMGWGTLKDIFTISQKASLPVHLAVSYNEQRNSKDQIIKREVFEAHLVDPYGIARSYRLKPKAESDLSNCRVLLQILKISMQKGSE